MKALQRLALIGGILAFVGVGTHYLSQRPIVMEATEPEVHGQPWLRNGDAPVALVVDTSIVAANGRSGSFGKTDWSYGWFNLLLQEAPNFDILDVSQIRDTAALNRRRTIIFTRSATSGMSPGRTNWADADWWRALSDSGRTVYFELPPNEFTGWAALDDSILRLERQGQTFNQVSYLLGPDTSTLSIPCFRLRASGARFAPLAAGVTIRMAMDSAPTLVESRLGVARALVAGFDFGALAVTVQQGRPENDFSVRPRVNKRDGALPLVTADLCADSSYRNTFQPFFDQFEEVLYAIIDPQAPEPTLIDSSPRVFVMSHDEEAMGDRAVWMARQERLWGVTSSYFVIPSNMTAAGYRALDSAGVEYALHADKYSLFDRPGLPGARPIAREVSFSEQASRLISVGTDTAAHRINRNHWLTWTDRYTENFRRLAAAGVRLDCSYGPLGAEVVGYLFGTRFPFVPLDTNGFPLPILELPFLFQDDERFAVEYLDSAFALSDRDAGVINFIYHVNTMSHSPDTLVMWSWRESFRRAQNAKAPITTYERVLEAISTGPAPLPW